MDSHLDDQALNEAAGWFARLRASDCSAADRAAFEAWRDAHPAHAEAYARAHRANAAVGQLLATDPRIQAMLDEAILAPGFLEKIEQEIGEEQPLARSRPQDTQRPTASLPLERERRWRIPAALAASVILGLCGVVGSHRWAREMPASVYETAAIGRTITLEDGSVVQLDVGSRLSVRLTPERRQLTLESGRALFDVAHDKTRPFSVTASTSRTTALGTQFQVELRHEAVLVTLAEGSVAVDNEAATQVWQEHLRPGEQLAIDVASAARAKHTIDPSLATSWSRGRLLFRGTPLAEAIEQVNRYATKKVRLGDGSLASLPVGGNFIAGDSELIVDALAAVLPLRVVDGGEKEIILFRRYDAVQSYQ